MVQILRHELKKQGNETVLFLYLDQSNTEFARELGSLDDNTKGDLDKSVNSYIRSKLPNLKQATVKIMVGGLLVTSFAFSPAVGGLFGGGDDNRAHAAELDVAYKGFADVSSDRESAPAIEALVKAGVITGYPDGFHPREDISRQHAAVMFVRALDLPTDNVVDPGFKDVPTTHPYYKEIAAATAAGYFNKADNFNPTNNFTRGQSASVIVRAYDLEADKASPFTDLAGSGHEDAIGIMYNLGLAKGVGNSFNPNDNVTREQFAMLLHRTIEAHDAVGAVATVSNASAVDTNKVEVNFSGAVKDTSKVTVQLKKGQATQYTTAKWAEDGKSVVLEAPSDIAPGDYDVVVTGLGDKEVRQTVTVAAEAAKSVELLNTSVAKMDDARVSFKVLNQYGTDMEVKGNSTDLAFSIYNVTQGKDLTAAGTSTSKSEITLNLENDANAKIGDKIRVISTYKGITETKELTVVAASAIADMDLGTAAFPQDATRFNVNTNDVKLPYTLKDQYGAEKKLTANQTGATIDGITFHSSDNSIVDPASFATDSTGALTFDVGAKAGTVTITSIINATGDVSTTTLTVSSTAGLKTVAVTSPTALISAGETVSLGLSAVDQYGAAVKDLTGVKVVSSNPAVTCSIVNGKLQVVTTGTTAGNATLTLKNAAEDVTYGSVSVNFEAAAVPTAITSVATPKALEFGADSDIKLSDIKVKDQYGRDYSLTDMGAVTVTTVDDTPDFATVTAGTGVYTVAAKNTAGTEAVTFTLANGASTTVNFAVVAPTSISTYTVDEVGTLYAPATANANYNKALTVTGKTADGTSVVLADNKVTHATSSNEAVATVSNAGVVTGLSKGTTTVTLWSGANKLADVTVNVDTATPVATKAVVDQTAALTASVGGTVDVANKLTVLDQYGVKVDNPKGFFASSDPSVATVNSSTGVVTGVKAGTTSITYITTNGISTTTTVEIR
jgi:trimeric autotransporter adhesin